MTNTELITLVRESVATVQATTPVEQIVRRGRAVRARRRIPRLAGALAVAVAAAAATALIPAGDRARHQPGQQLAAWTVTRQADGSIQVAIRELRDPSGLQSKLRAEGVPASVLFADQRNPCWGYRDAPGLLPTVLQIGPGLPRARSGNNRSS
jgi:hypothetical protein